jgi:hypothetical protein
MIYTDNNNECDHPINQKRKKDCQSTVITKPVLTDIKMADFYISINEINGGSYGKNRHLLRKIFVKEKAYDT